MISKPATYIKALLAFAGSLCTGLGSAAAAGGITQAAALTAVGLACAAATAVFAIPNKPLED